MGAQICKSKADHPYLKGNFVLSQMCFLFVIQNDSKNCCNSGSNLDNTCVVTLHWHAAKYLSCPLVGWLVGLSRKRLNRIIWASFIKKSVKSRRAFTHSGMVWFIAFGQLRMKDKMSFQNPILSEHYLEGVVLKTHLSLNALSDNVYVIRNYFKIQFLYRKRNNS